MKVDTARKAEVCGCKEARKGKTRLGRWQTFLARSVDGRLKISARAEIVLPKPISSARIPPLLDPVSIAFNHVKAIFWCSY